MVITEMRTKKQFLTIFLCVSFAMSICLLINAGGLNLATSVTDNPAMISSSQLADDIADLESWSSAGSPYDYDVYFNIPPVKS